jgi:hypothetical protein
MNISNSTVSTSILADPGRSAVEGIRNEEQRFVRNVEEIAKTTGTTTQNEPDLDKALVEQIDIQNAFNANARSLEVASQLAGTIIDIKV